MLWQYVVDTAQEIQIYVNFVFKGCQGSPSPIYSLRSFLLLLMCWGKDKENWYFHNVANAITFLKTFEYWNPPFTKFELLQGA